MAKKLVLLSLLCVAIFIAFEYPRLSQLLFDYPILRAINGRAVRDVPSTNDVIISEGTNNQKVITNNKYHFTMQIPPGIEGYKTPELMSVQYFDKNTTPLEAGMYIELLAKSTTSIKVFYDKYVSSNLNTEEVKIGPFDAIRTIPAQDGSERYYWTYFIQGPDNLIFSIRFDTADYDQYRSLFEQAIQSFREIDKKNEQKPNRVSLSGRITKTTGNCMPSIGAKASCRTNPIQTKIYIYPLTKRFNFTDNPSEPILAQTTSNILGNYSVSLPPGAYSIFVDDNGRKVCSGGDGFGFACKVILYETNEYRDIRINNAAY